MSKISDNNIAQGVYKAVKGKTGAELESALASTFMLLAKKGLLKRSEVVINALHEIINKENKVIDVKLYSAVKLTPDNINEIQDALKSRYDAETVNISQLIDESLIGGIKIIIGDEILDLTFKKKVAQLKKHLLN